MKGKFKHKESRGLPGGPNEMFTYITGVFSTEGYKSDSPDVNNPFNVIPSGNITMKGVDFPVMGTDNLGNTKLMKPGKDYKFPGDMVFEVPMSQFGGMTRKKVDKILDKNKNLNFVQRMYQENTPSMIIPGQKGPSTHFMESSDNIVYPTVVQMPDGTLQYLESDDAYNYAVQSGEYIKLPNERQARRFGESYKKGTGVLKDFQKSEMQRGGQMNEEGQKQRNWLDSYIRSDKYLERLGKEMTGFMPGAYDANKVANERWARLMNLRNTPIGFLPESSDISPTPGDVQGVYDADEYPGMIMLRPEYKKGRQGPWSYNTTSLHEMGHGVDGGGNRIPQFTKDLLMSTLKDNDLGIPKEEYYYTQPTEYINRLQPFRYLLQEEGIYDARTEDFTEKHLQKAKENTRIELNRHFQDLLRNTKSEKDLINLMNIIAMDERSQGSPTAQFGIEMDSEVPSNIIEQTPDANYFQKLFRPKYYKDLIKSEMKDLDSYGYNKLLKKEYQLEGGTKAERDEINKIIQGRKDRLQGVKFIEDVDLLKSMSALGAYDKGKNALIYNKAYKNDSNPIDDHEIGHLYDSVKRPGPAFTSKLYDIYKDKNILNPDVIANINNYQPSMTSDQFINETSEKRNKLTFDFEKSLPKFSAVRGGVGDPQRGRIIGYTDKATNQFISNQDLGNYVSENYKDIFADPSNYREVISKYKKYKNANNEDLSIDERNQLVEDLKKEMPAFRKYTDEQDKIWDQYINRLYSGEFDEGDARTVEQVKSDLLNNLEIDSFNPDIFSKEDDLDDREKNIHNFYVPTEVKARLRAIRKEAEKQGYRKGTDFKGYLDKVKNNSPNVRMQYDQLKQKLKLSDEEIDEFMLLFAKNNQPDNNLSIAQNGKSIVEPTYVLPEVTVIGNKKGFDWKNLINNSINPLYQADNALQILGIPANFVRESIEGLSNNGDGEFNWGNIIPDVMNTTMLDNDPAQKSVSETLGVDGFWKSLGVDLLTDPATYVGAGVLKNMLVKSGKKVIPSVIKPFQKEFIKQLNKIPSKVNPNYFTPNPNMYYRGIGRGGMQDALQSKSFRAKPASKIPAEMSGGFDMAKRFKQVYYSPEFRVADKYGAGYISEVPKKSANFTPRYKGTDWSMLTKDQIPISEGRILEKNWWSGYKEIKEYGGSIPKVQTGGEYIVKSGDTFDGIANKVGVKRKDLELANPGARNKLLQLNQKLLVPSTSIKSKDVYSTVSKVPSDFLPEPELNIEALKKGIAQAESLSGKLMVNPQSTATGLYGQRFSELEDTDLYKGTRKDFAKDLEAQNRVFEIRLSEGIDGKRGLIEDAEDLYAEYSPQIEGFDFSKEELIALANFLGRQGTRNYLGYHLRDGKPLSKALPNIYGSNAAQANKTPEQYLKTIREYLQKDFRAYSKGGELNDLNIYSNYINGNYDDVKLEKEAQKVYDKLNRIHYKNAKQFGMSAPNYIMTYLLKNPNG